MRTATFAVENGVITFGVCMLLVLSSVAAGACTHAPGGWPQVEIYERAKARLEVVDLFKPMETAEPDLPFRLAPFVLHEAGSTEASSRFGCATNRSRAEATMCVGSDVLKVHQRSYARLTYTWGYAEPRALSSNRLAQQGIRITLNAMGHPVIWEVLADKSEARLVFVARSLESAAEAEFGQPLAGRRYAVERSVAEAPKLIVARVIEDGPVPMGPMVYLEARTHSARTVICRCMPAEAKEIRHTKEYELARMPVPEFRSAETERPLEQMLRLPKSF